MIHIPNALYLSQVLNDCQVSFSGILLCRCQLFLSHIAVCAQDQGLEVHSTLPLVTPLPLQPTGILYVELNHQRSYLVICVEPGLMDYCYLLQLLPASTETSSGVFTTSCLVELEPNEIEAEHLRAVLGESTPTSCCCSDC